MKNLHQLYDDMIAQNVISTIFNIVYNKHMFSCIFIIGTSGHQLYMTTVEKTPHTILVNINSDFQTPTSLCHEYYMAIANYLGFTASKNNPFRPGKFFEEFDSYIPMRHDRTPSVSMMISIIGTARNVPDSEKIYFTHWKKNPDGAHVSEGNYWKTRSIVGEETANYFRKKNISSCWSDIPHDENLHLINQYADFL